jgi:response regulator of citrate/malate metabolism
MRLLFIDDDKGFHDLAEQASDFYGVEFRAADNWVDAEHLLESFKPTHIFIDIFMPKGSGIDFVRRHQDYDGNLYLITSDFERERITDELNAKPLLFSGTIVKDKFLDGIKLVVNHAQRLHA